MHDEHVGALLRAMPLEEDAGAGDGRGTGKATTPDESKRQEQEETHADTMPRPRASSRTAREPRLREGLAATTAGAERNRAGDEEAHQDGRQRMG